MLCAGSGVVFSKLCSSFIESVILFWIIICSRSRDLSQRLCQFSSFFSIQISQCFVKQIRRRLIRSRSWGHVFVMGFCLESKTKMSETYLYFKGLNELDPGLYLPGPGPSSGDFVQSLTPNGIFGPSPYLYMNLQLMFFPSKLPVLVSIFILYLHFVFIQED